MSKILAGCLPDATFNVHKGYTNLFTETNQYQGTNL